MADSESLRQSLNPLFLQLQKMELELKCLNCLNMLKSPMLMPCDHIFCCNCITTFTETLKCPVCMRRCFHKDVKPVSHIEKMINIHKTMSSILDANLPQRVPSVEASEAKLPSSSENPVSRTKTDEVNLQEELTDKISGKSPSNANSCVPSPESLNNGNSRKEAKLTGNELCDIKTNTPCTRDEALIVQCESSSPPSIGTLNESDYERNDQGSEHKTNKLAAKRLYTEGLKGLSEDTGVIKDTLEDNATESKKQKLSNEPDVAENDNDLHHKNLLKSNSKTGNNCEDHSSIYKAETSECPSASASFNCAFCHSFKITEGSGEMLHYLNGEPVEGDMVSNPKVVHVHQKCIEWAPQIYFVGENIFNLKEELLRASKIKCTHCGLKGAALGCYMKSCRKSFHVPCAYGISDCRWDCENYLVLCPTHSANKLPCDKSKKNKKIKANDSVGCVDQLQVRASPTPQQCDDLMTSSSWLFCGSALSKEEKALLDKFAILMGAEVTSSWKENVTHVIAGTDEHGACSRTLKFLMAILSGKWILSLDWIKDCMEVGLPVAEEPYEIRRDVHGSFDGPKNGRIRAMEKAPKLFSGLSFYFCGYFDPCHKGRIEELVTTAGGALKLQKSKNSKETTPTMFVVYSADPPEGCDPGKLSEVIADRRKNAEALAARTGSRAIAHTWLLDAIAGCKLQLEE